MCVDVCVREREREEGGDNLKKIGCLCKEVRNVLLRSPQPEGVGGLRLGRHNERTAKYLKCRVRPISMLKLEDEILSWIQFERTVRIFGGVVEMIYRNDLAMASLAAPLSVLVGYGDCYNSPKNH